MIPRRKVLAVVTAAMSIVAVAGCGDLNSNNNSGDADAASSVYAKFGSKTPAERDPELLKIAKKEGSLQFYSGWTYADKMGKAFQAKYGIPVTTYSADNETVMQKVQQEAKARRTQADLIEMGYLEMTALDHGKMFYVGWKPGLQESVSISPGWFPTRFLAFVTGWNTDKVPPADVPKSYQDLADPKYAGKITVEQGDYDWYAALETYFTKNGMSQEEFDDMFAGIVKNAKVVKGHTAMAQHLASGEDTILADGYSQSVDDLAAKGAPIAWQTSPGKPAVEPIVVYPSGVGLVGTSPHPAAAMLMADFMLSEEGQKIYADNKAITADPAVNPFLKQYKTILPPADKLISSQDYADKYANLLAGNK